MASKQPDTGLGEENCLRDPSGSRLERKIGIGMVLKQPAAGLGGENGL